MKSIVRPFRRLMLSSSKRNRLNSFFFDGRRPTSDGAESSNAQHLCGKSPFQDVEVDDKCLHDFCLDKFEKFGSSIALINTDNDEKLTFVQIVELCHRFSHGLHEDGIEKGDRVTVSLANCPEFAVVILGICRAGGVASLINPEYTKDELIFHFNVSRPSFVFTRKAHLTKILQAAAASDCTIKRIYVVDGHDEIRDTSSNILLSTYQHLISNSASRHTPPPRMNTRTDLALLPFSSGTTGRPKGIMLSHYNFTSLLQIFYQPSRYDLTLFGEHSVSALPFYHIYGLVQLLFTISAGATMHTMPYFKKDVYLRVIRDKRVPVIFVVPPILNLLSKDKSVAKSDLSSVRTCISGAAPSGKQMLKEMESKFPNMRVVQGYGMTEVCGVSHLTPKTLPKTPKSESSGTLLSNYVTKIVNPETGAELGVNQVGELCVKGQTCMLGYYNDQKATDEIYDEEQYLHTGDLCYFDEDRYVYIVDRLKELIKVRGFQVAPAELEDILRSHKDVKDVAVVGIPHSSDGEVPKAFVVLNDSHTSAQELLDFVNSKVIRYKHLRGGIEFVKEVPRAPSGKILRRLFRPHLRPEKTATRT